MNKTNIEWCDFTANPLKYRDAAGNVVWGCVKTSPGCTNCYAEALAHRYGRGGPFKQSVMDGLTPFLDEAELHKMLTAKTIAGVPVSGSKTFIGDMTDVFGEWVPDELLDRLFAVFALRPDVTFQVLTKRADRMREYLSDEHLHQRIHEAVKRRMGYDHPDRPAINRRDLPLPNVWLGVSVEDQQRADERVPLLLQVPAAVRFLSAEPLLGPVDLSPWLGSASLRAIRHMMRTGEPASVGRDAGSNLPATQYARNRDGTEHGPGVDWIIVGGESGHDARPCRVEWIRSIVRQCQAASVPCFVKQLGANYADERNGVCGRSTRWPLDVLPGGPTRRLADRKGGDQDEWPEQLRVREFPAATN